MKYLKKKNQVYFEVTNINDQKAVSDFYNQDNI